MNWLTACSGVILKTNRLEERKLMTSDKEGIKI